MLYEKKITTNMPHKLIYAFNDDEQIDGCQFKKKKNTEKLLGKTQLSRGANS